MKYPERIDVDVRPSSRTINWPWVAVYAILVFMVGSLIWLVQSFQ